MKEWFIVKYNWLTTVNACKLLSIERYLGLGGDILPNHDHRPTADRSRCECEEFAARIENGREYVSLNSRFIHVCTDFGAARDYSSAMSRCSGRMPMILAVSTMDNGGGVDFGNPEGLYSVIETEIITRGDTASAMKYLDLGTGLFKDLRRAREYVGSLPTDGTVEELGGWDYVYLRELT